MAKLLSIIVPSYNMEKYLPKCLGSLVVAAELMEKLEVLVVNDGSTDRTSEIAHEFAAKYPGTFKVIDKANGNYGSCINAALPVASGEYVKILDADDYFDTSSFSTYINYLDTVSDADLVITDYDIVNEVGDVTAHNHFDFDDTQTFDVTEVLKSRVAVQMHGYTYRAQILVNYGYCQLEGVSYTDTEWILIPLPQVRGVRYYPKVIYKYLVGRLDQTMNADKMAKSWWMCGKVVIDIASKLNKNLVEPSTKEIDSLLCSRVCGLAQSSYRAAIFGLKGRRVEFDLAGFDKALKNIAPKVYDSLGNVTYSRRLPFRYVRAWRSRSAVLPLMVYICRLYSKFAMLISRLWSIFETTSKG